MQMSSWIEEILHPFQNWMPFLKPLIRDGETKLKKNPPRFSRSSSRLEEAFQTNKRWKSTIFVSFPVDVFASFFYSKSLLFFFFFLSTKTQCSPISQTARSLLLNAIIFLFHFYLEERGLKWMWLILKDKKYVRL